MHFIFANATCGFSGGTGVFGGVTKVDSTGHVKWSRSVVLTGLGGFETNDKGFLIVGNGPVCGVKRDTWLPGEIGLIKIDSVGNGVGCVGSAAVSETPITATASAVSFTVAATGTLSTFSPFTNTLALSTHSNCVSVFVSVNENSTIAKTVAAYPNPFSSKTTLRTTEVLWNATFTVENSMGQVVRQTMNISDQTITFSRENLPAGVYFFRLTDSGKVIATGKMVISD